MSCGCIQEGNFALRQIIIGGGYLVSSRGWICVLVSGRYPHVNMTIDSIFNCPHSLRSMAFPKTITPENLPWDPVSAFARSRQRYTVTQNRTSSFCAAWINFHCRDRVMVKFYAGSRPVWCRTPHLQPLVQMFPPISLTSVITWDELDIRTHMNAMCDIIGRILWPL